MTRSRQDKLNFDSAPRAGSTNPVTSGGVYEALINSHIEITFDDEPVAGSENAVKSGGIYTALQGKQDDLTQQIEIAAEVHAPIEKGQTLGKVAIG